MPCPRSNSKHHPSPDLVFKERLDVSAAKTKRSADGAKRTNGLPLGKSVVHNFGGCAASLTIWTVHGTVVTENKARDRRTCSLQKGPAPEVRNAVVNPDARRHILHAGAVFAEAQGLGVEFETSEIWGYLNDAFV